MLVLFLPSEIASGLTPLAMTVWQMPGNYVKGKQGNVIAPSKKDSLEGRGNPGGGVRGTRGYYIFAKTKGEEKQRRANSPFWHSDVEVA
jgi:hypothetical protein